MNRPCFKPHFRVVPVEGEGLYLLSERASATKLHGRLYERIAPLLDGRRSVRELVAELRGQLSAAEVYYALGHLERKGYLTEGTVQSPQSAFWSSQGLDLEQTSRRLAEARISVTAVGDVDPGPLLEALGRMNLTVCDPADLAVVITDDYLRNPLQAHNRQALDSGRPWLLLRPVGAQIWLGPLIRPGCTGCWACLAHRLRANRPLEGYLQQRLASTEMPGPQLRGTVAAEQAAANLAAHAIATWAARGDLPALENRLIIFDLLTLCTETHLYARLPNCPACGQPQEENACAPVRLSDRAQILNGDGGYRAVAPEETLRRYAHLVGPVTGVVPVLERAGDVDGIVHVYRSGYNPARFAREPLELQSDPRSSSSGKGTTEAQAKASALCEALERHSGIFRGDEPRRRARLIDLGDTAIHPNACMLYSHRQFAERATRNARHSRFNWITAPFDVEREVEWTPLWSLTGNGIRYLPTAFCYYSYPQPFASATTTSCSNGNAAGNTLEEAILQAFLELVERDAVALWWYNRLRRPGVDLETCGEPYVAQITAHLSARGREMWVLDLTSDLQIPTFAAVSRRAQPVEQIMLGFGAHLDPRIAVLRAITELNQMLTWVMADKTEPEDREIGHWLATATLANQPYVAPDPAVTRRCLADYARCWTGDLRDDVLLCKTLVERLGMEMLILDQTRPDIGLPVVKVVVPGLRHFWERLAPGRLYDVPVKMGWLERPLREEELNPIGMFL